MAKFEIKRDATQPVLRAELQDGNGSPVDLSNSDYIFFHMATNDNQHTPVFSGAATIQDTGSTSGRVQYNFTTNNTSGTGNFLGEFAVTFVGGQRLTLPADDGLFIKIFKDYE